jgi:hypothetical protein
MPLNATQRLEPDVYPSQASWIADADETLPKRDGKRQITIRQ